MTQEQQGFREGSRWIHERPTSEEFAEWFKTVRIHEGMKHENYVGGITLIPASEKVKIVRTLGNGRTAKVEEYRDVFTPYAKVETRVAYFWDLCAERGWLGEIEPVIPKNAMSEFKGISVGEPFYLMPYAQDNGQVAVRLGCSMRVRVYEASATSQNRKPIMLPPAGTKVGKFSGDENAALRVETGAVGRSLGMAGMLVIPGSGVATAEDMQELAGLPATTGEEPALVDPNAEGNDLRSQADALRQRIESDFPALADELEQWAQGRKINLNEISDTQLRAVVKQMEKVLEKADAQVPA